MQKKIATRLSIVAALALSLQASAQDIHFTEFDAAPMIINPAFTGMFDGMLRADGIYRTQWASVTVPYVTFAASADMPIYTERNGDYLAAGLQLYKDQAGDANLANTTAMASIAYHKTFGGGGDRSFGSNDLAVGLQAGYAQKSIDLSKLYFGDEFVNGTFVQGTSQEYHLGIGNSVNYYLVNAGVSFSHSNGSNVSYILGLAANNLNQPNDAIEEKQNQQTGLDMRYTAELGVDWSVSSKLMLRPAVLYQYQASATEIIAGNEFHYILTEHSDVNNFTTAVFLGGWYRSGDATMITAGMEFSGFRIGCAYDYNISALNTASNGNGGFEISVRYILPPPMAYVKKRTVPFSRF